MPNPSQEPPASSKPQIRTERIWMFFSPSKSRYRAKIHNKGKSKTSDYIQIKIKMPNLSQESPASLKAPNQDFKDMDVLCTLNLGVARSNDHIQIKIKIPSSSQLRSAQWSSAIVRYLVYLRLAQKTSAFIMYSGCLKLAQRSSAIKYSVVSDLSLEKLSWFGYSHWSLICPCSKFWLPILILKFQRTLMSLKF